MNRHYVWAAGPLLFVGLLLAGLLVELDALAAGRGAPVAEDDIRVRAAVPGDAVKRSSSVLALTRDGATLLVVNPDSNSLSVVDTASQAVLAEVWVGLDPRAVAVDGDGRRAYVANQGSDSLSVVDVASRQVVAEVPVGDRPVGVAVAPGDRFVAVAELGDDQVRFVDTGDLVTRSTTGVADRPHGLAFTPDGRRLLVSHLLSGEVTILPVRPFTLYLPLVLRTSSAPSVSHAFQAPSPALRSASAASRIPTWPNVAPAPSVVINAAGNRAYLPQTMAHGLGLNIQFDNSVFPKVSVLDLVAEEHLLAEHVSLPETDQPVGLPWDADLRDGDAGTGRAAELWVVNAASNDVSIVDIGDPANPRRVANVPVGHNPRGIALSPDGGRAYVNNALDGTVSVIDGGVYTVTAIITVTEIPLPPVLLNGKRLYHSSARPELARASWIACNTCHIEGEHDGRTWLLQYVGELPPDATVQGTPVITRNTTSLLGMVETYPLRWSAEWDESADSEFSIRFEQFGAGLIDGEMHPTLGPPNQGRSSELDSLAAFIDSLAVPPRSRMLTPAAQRGKAVFESEATGCAECHPAPLYTDLTSHDVGTADAPGEWFGPLIDTPTLRYLYDSAPYLHDGSAATVGEVLTSANPNDVHGATSHLSEQELEDLIAFLLALPYR